MSKKKGYEKTEFNTAKTPPKPKFIPAEKKTCPRCKGDGIWHSPKTGVRAKTSSEPLVDESQQCPKCKGTGKV